MLSDFYSYKVSVTFNLIQLLLIFLLFCPLLYSSALPRSTTPGQHLHTPSSVCVKRPLQVPRRVRPRQVQHLLHIDASCGKKPHYVRHLNGKAVVVDVGAHYGEELIGYKGLVSRIYAFEASPSKIEIIMKVVALANMTDVVTVTHAAVSNITGVGRFHTSSRMGSQQDTIGSVGLGHVAPKKLFDYEVSVVTLDSVIDEHIDFLKIDTQGHELMVLKGAERLILEKGIDILHLEFSPSLTLGHGYRASEILEYLHSLDYTCFSCDTGDDFGPAHLRPNPNVSWNFSFFEREFLPWEALGIPGHGTWADIVCV